jgi:hypothetical protein
MDLQGLRTRSIGVKVHHSMGFALMMGLGLSACGPQISSERNELKVDEGTIQTYQEWCTGWELNCPADEPGKTAPMTAAQFKALSTILNSALSSPSVFNVTREELDAEGLKQAMTALKLDDVYLDVQARLDARQWQSGGLDKGALVSNHAVSSSVRTDAGLVWNMEAVQKVALTPGAIQLSGVGVSADAAKESPVLQSMAVANDGNFNLSLQDRAVSGLPQDFALENLLLAFGLDVSKLDGKEIALPDVIEAGAPLVGWLNQSSRQITLERSFFATSAGELGALLPEDGLGQTLGNLLGRFEKLRTSSDPRNNLATVSLIKGATAKCDVNSGDVKVKFSAEFGVKRIYQPKAGTLGLEFYGLEASAKKALGIGIKLKRVELSADKITILDVPIIGKVDVKLDDVIGGPDQKTTLVCGA